jgi:hypothetical protein
VSPGSGSERRGGGFERSEERAVFLGEKIKKVDTEISGGEKIKQNGELLPSFSTLPLASSPPLAVHPTSSLSRKQASSL